MWRQVCNLVNLYNAAKHRMVSTPSWETHERAPETGDLKALQPLSQELPVRKRAVIKQLSKSQIVPLFYPTPSRTPAVELFFNCGLCRRYSIVGYRLMHSSVSIPCIALSFYIDAGGAGPGRSVGAAPTELRNARAISYSCITTISPQLALVRCQEPCKDNCYIQVLSSAGHAI